MSPLDTARRGRDAALGRQLRVTLALVIVTLGAAGVWAELHTVRVERDRALTLLCESAAGRAREDLDRDYAALGVPSVETFAGDPRHRSYTTLVTSLRSFTCEVDLDATGRVEIGYPRRVPTAESRRGFELPSGAPAWAEDIARPARWVVSSIRAALTP